MGEALREGPIAPPLPPERIAQIPAPERDAARLLVVRRTPRGLFDRRFAELPGLLPPGSLIVLNDTRVLPARLEGRRLPGAGRVEALYLAGVPDAPPGRWKALLRPGHRLRAGLRIEFTGGLVGLLAHRTPEGAWILEGSPPEGILGYLDRWGRPPLPPYIRRPPTAADRERYQTVYAAEEGSVAAPTAGLHFTDPLLEALRAAGHRLVRLTLHIGWGTFLPLDRPHPPPPERFRIPKETAEAVAGTLARRGTIVAVGTSTTRALEEAALGGSPPEVWQETALVVRPGFRFRIVGALLTNFHLPRTSVLSLASAFAGPPLLREAYDHARAGGYAFGSYGDATLLL